MSDSTVPAKVARKRFSFDWRGDIIYVGFVAVLASSAARPGLPVHSQLLEHPPSSGHRLGDRRRDDTGDRGRRN